MRAALLLGLVLASLGALVAGSLALALDDGPNKSGEFVSNGDFEDGVTAWEWLGGDLTTVPDPFDSDSVGAFRPSSPAVFAYFYQPLDILPGGSYQLSGTFVDSDGDIDVLFEVWPYSENGDPLLSNSVGPISQPGEWSTGVFVLPCHAASADVAVTVVGTAGSVAYFDDISLKGSPPAVPCATATATPSLTLAPTVTGSPTPTPLISSTPTSTTAPAPTATATSTFTSAPAVSPTPTVPPTPSHGLLINGGFEAARDGAPLGWSRKGGVFSQVEEPAHSGAASGAFFSATGSTKWVYQTVAVTPSTWYELDGYLYHDDPWVESAFLRISWYTSSDGSGSAIATTDSTSSLDEPQAGFRHLTTGPVQAPPGAQSARVRVLLRPVSAVGALIYVDDMTFRSAAPPATPTPTATRTPTPVPPRTPTVTPTPVGPAVTLPPPATVTPTPVGPAVTLPSPATVTPTLVANATASPVATAPIPTPTSTIVSAAPDAEHGLVVNGGFEAFADGELVGWSKQGGVLAQVDDPVRGGDYAAGFFSSTTSTKWIHQAVQVTPTEWYRLDAYVYHDDPHVEAALLRISWYASDDGSGRAVDTVDSTIALEQLAGEYRALTTGSVRAPPGVHSARARVLLRPRSETSALIYIDDVSFGPAPPAPVEPEAASSSGTSSGRGGSGGGSSASSGGRSSGTSSVVGVSVRSASEPVVIVPQPTPLIRRSPLGVPQDGSGSDGWWPWVAGAAIGAALAGAIAVGVRRLDRPRVFRRARRASL